jgi:glyoxylase-like metal-dependent hydrolase (beta-lactamase superfamily II)
MITLAPGVDFADLEFQGMTRVIATAFLHGPAGITIVDPGPTTTLPVLDRHLTAMGATLRDVTALFLTHIHLDHAGATGTLLKRNERIKVYVHEIGAPHMIDPAKLLASAGRLYGDAMERLWGEVAPVPASAVMALKGGDSLQAAGRTWDVAHTPGHASHHVSYFSADTGIAFVGDTAGVRVVPGGYVLPPTPPPDIDLPLWLASLATIERWHPQTLFLTHFGPSNGVRAHVAELRDHLQLSERLVHEALSRTGDEQSKEEWFIDQWRREIARRVGDADLRAYELAGRFDLNWLGMVRYVTKRMKA